MSLTAYFALGTEPDTAEVQVQNRVNLALPGLPDAVRTSGVEVQKRSASILLLIALYSPDGSYDEQYIGNYANLVVKTLAVVAKLTHCSADQYRSCGLGIL